RRRVDSRPVSDDVERAANGSAVGPQSAPLVDGVLTSLCRPWRPEPHGPPRVPALADDARAQSRARSACAWDAVTLRQRLSGERSPRSSRYLLTPNPACPFTPLPTDGPMALSRCPQKGERIEGLADDAEPTSNVAEAWGLITSDAMMRRSYRAISWDGIIEYLQFLRPISLLNQASGKVFRPLSRHPPVLPS